MHYNQDYLLHPVRTDFTGRNGIGKSLIADLLQIIFIADKSKIKFGTESVKKKDRQIHTLPYKTTDAYAFINIEVSKDRFMVMGVNIRSKKSQHLRSFWILDKAYREGESIELSELLISKENLILHKDFIVNQKIPSIEELSRHLRDNKNVYLRHFTYREDKNELYSFLYNKEILPINLVLEENLNAFAKIIQSFSKAKTLDTEDDRSLKDFLFESSADAFEKQYEEHKESLDKLLNDYKELEEYIDRTTLKRSRLTTLKDYEEARDEANKKLLLANFIQSRSDLDIARKASKRAQRLYELETEKHNKLKDGNPKLSRIAGRAKELLESSETALPKLTEYKDIYSLISADLRTIKELSSIELPDIEGEKKEDLDITQYDQKEIRRRIDHFVTIYNRYGSIENITNKIAEQSELVSKRKTELEIKIKGLEDIIELLSKKKEGTLFSKLLDEQQVLSEAQETILISLLVDVNWERPDQVMKGIRYVDDFEVLNEKKIYKDKENKGYWFDAGGLNHFVPISKEKRVFADKANLTNAASSKKEELQSRIDRLSSEIEELDKFQKGQKFQSYLIETDYELDQDVLDFTVQKELKKGLGIIQNLSRKISEIECQVDVNNLRLKEVSEKLTILPDNEELSQQLMQLQNTIAVRRKREQNLREELIKREKDEEYLSIRLPELCSSKITTQEHVNSATTKYNSHTNAMLKALPETDIASIIEQDYLHFSIQDLEDDLSDKKEDYVTEYKSLANHFEETKFNIEIKEQLDQKTYVFEVLEAALLGRIGHRDNIEDALKSANRERLKMMDAIHETMLNIFKQTKGKYEEYRSTIGRLNTFFKGKKISEQYYFQIKFDPHDDFDINWINKLQHSAKEVYKEGELAFGETVEAFVEDFFQKATGYGQKIKLVDLLNPKTYFTLKTKFTDEDNQDKPGSTGESYSAIVLLGIGRLSIVHEKNRPGIKFLILEETANLDRVNFNTFPDIANKFGYQILTMTPRPYGSDSEQGWYLHCLLRGVGDKYKNYPVPNSYFKTNESKEDLTTFLAANTD
ncbi:hypothetical protein PbJCM13498_40520 [Prolixibacter bellariivorans]|uniref:MukB N-terminal domain-containing protein n=2 Tax=Prolixibacter bellariivorans TaxID=314319 RepID=A0A5M4B4U3_9BACT|nr:hypothetical protein PbJCM13498_40520 [Prolixibacter bellariivorans]